MGQLVTWGWGQSIPSAVMEEQSQSQEGGQRTWALLLPSQEH